MITQGCGYGSESGDLKEGLKEGGGSFRRSFPLIFYCNCTAFIPKAPSIIRFLDTISWTICRNE